MSRRISIGVVLAVLICILAPVSVLAQNKPVQVALVTPIQIFPEKYTITGIRLNLLYGRNVSVQGIDIGLINHTTTGQFQGLQWGLVGLTDASFTGLAGLRSECRPGTLRRVAMGFCQLCRGHERTSVWLCQLLQEDERPANWTGEHHQTGRAIPGVPDSEMVILGSRNLQVA